ncbi:TKL protein kinase [Sphaeroforma arctica JP610]|uniref:non-specific serine/threonine protein kinase n=1 Tax=Sphaeroforma arctica JP610 TaxID=667725 RepID=A0A0L0FSR4_9EUKA|nr:TKL protein kinase [Sphaeroforma arctica JP610]KNC79847.1 TKL protein kinase [Sphaeroforma arctica JP610]|eukprot:XP_014153749.1 TKL protein kinase [Sphaeroforma arctica JP610]
MALSLDVDIIIVLCIVLSFIGLCLAIILWQLIRRGYVGRTVKVNVKGDGTQRFEINDLFNSTDPSDRGMSQHERGVRSIQVAWEDISVGPLLGKGSFGVVYKAKYRGSDVAVKTLLDQSLHARVLKEFESECMIFAELRHPNLILFMGVVTTVPHLSIVTELLPNGALSNVLMDERIFIDVGRRLQMALDICLGMAYLHTNKPPIIHRDLKSPNILVDSNFTLKIGDFGLAGLVAAEPLIADPDVPECSTMSVVPDEVSSSATLPVFSERSRTSHRFLSKIFMNGSEPGPSDRNVTGIELHAVAIPMQEDTSFRVPEPAPPPKPKNKFAGTIMWAAPEVLRLEGCTKSSDIYSFGIVLWELAMRKKPYEDMHPLSVRYQVMRQGARPTPLPEATNSIRDLMESCWAEKVEDRPESFVAIAKQIEKYRDDEGFSQDLASLGRTTSTGLSSVYNSNASDAPSLFHGMDIIRAGVLLACVVEPTTPVNYLKILEEARKTLDSVVESATSEYTCHVEKISRNKFRKSYLHISGSVWYMGECMGLCG